MADANHIIPFIKKAEGGYVNDPDDKGGETNKGITWKTWLSVFDDNSHDKFLAMSDEDWALVFKHNFWNAILGDLIHSQRIADMVVDFVWGSGKYYPECDVQDILIHCFGQHIAEDGDFGQATINAINSVDEETLYNDIVAKRFWYFDQCVLKTPTDAKYIQGWKNRLNALIKWQ
jgi:lysozyme family protein